MTEIRPAWPSDAEDMAEVQNAIFRAGLRARRRELRRVVHGVHGQAHVRDAETICSRIEDLRVDRTFDAVLLASHLVNVPDASQRHRLLATCRRYVKDDGRVLIQRFTPNWASEAGGRTDLGAGVTQEVAITPNATAREADVSVVATYTMSGRQWVQRYVTSPLDDDDLSADDCDQIETHLGTCPPCQAFLNTLQRTVDFCRDNTVDSLNDPRHSDLKKTLRKTYLEAAAELAKS